MHKVYVSIATILAGIATALSITSTVLAWHPQGKIIKSVQDITTNSQVSNATTEASALSIAPGDTLRYTVTVSNGAAPTSNHDNDMAFTVMTDILPTGVELVGNASQRQITADIGTILPGNSVTKQYEVKVTSTTDADVITNKACFTGNSIAKDNPQSGCSTVVAKVHVPLTPIYTCNQLRATSDDSRTVTINTFDITAVNGAAFNNAVVNWGDNTTPLTTLNVLNQKHQYAADGSYKVTATAHFTVNGEDKSTSSPGCTANVSLTTPQTPQQLPNTGMSNILVPAIGTGLIGYALYALKLKRRALQR